MTEPRMTRADIMPPVAPVEPSDEELLESAAEALGYKRIPIYHEGGAVEAYSFELLAFARAVLARWGHPAS